MESPLRASFLSWAILASAALVSGCGALSDGDASSSTSPPATGANETSEGDDVAALETASLPRGAFFQEESSARRGDAILGFRLVDGGKADVLYSYRGSDERIETSCRATVAVKSSRGSQSVEFSCPGTTSPMVFKLAHGESPTLELENAEGETMKLAKADPSFRGSPRLECDAETFTARIDVAAGGKRVLLATKPKQNAEYNTPPNELLFLSRIANAFEGLDLNRNEYDLALPAALEGTVTVKLGFLDDLAPGPSSQRVRREHSLSCEVVR